MWISLFKPPSFHRHVTDAPKLSVTLLLLHCWLRTDFLYSRYPCNWRKRNSVILRFATSRRYNLSGPITLRWLVLSIQPFFLRPLSSSGSLIGPLLPAVLIVSIPTLLRLYARQESFPIEKMSDYLNLQLLSTLL